ncbi:MAG: MBL fold metallo-hydrolase [Clostridia bacterium]|nr:MBL fold metallo-hydrolase [Clostridia bacterium]
MSKIVFLGTGAADWHMTQDIENPDFRALSGMLIDGHIMIDCGPGAFVYEDKYGKSGIYRNVDTVFVTHSHDDHFGKAYVERLCAESEKNITLYGDKALEQFIPQCKNLTFVALDASAHQTVECGGYSVTALKSNHATRVPGEQTHHYYFKGEKNLFIGYDGAWLIADTWEFLQKNPIDVYVIDATCGEDFRLDFRNFSHNNLHMIDFMYETFIANNVMTKDSKLILTHLAKTLHPSNADTKLIANKRGYEMAYDGMELEF